MRVILRLTGIGCILFFLCPLFCILSLCFGKKLKKFLKKATYTLVCRCLGIKTVKVTGELSSNKKVVLMCNHVSYADILVLGSVLPCNFVSKDDVRNWPLIGWYATCYDTVFISRQSLDIRKGLDKLLKALEKENMIVLFPESTTNDGCRLLDFKTSYFQLDPSITVQPVSLRYEKVNGLPATRFFKKIFSWRGEDTLFEHLKCVLKIRRIDARVMIHPALAHHTHRKQLALECFKAVEQGLKT